MTFEGHFSTVNVFVVCISKYSMFVRSQLQRTDVMSNYSYCSIQPEKLLYDANFLV